ncbi:MAG: ABC transporter ATP-binding protein [Synergistes sp.]|nr:ABC transporter ATP-binding protein [Synergistes sp.]
MDIKKSFGHFLGLRKNDDVSKTDAILSYSNVSYSYGKRRALTSVNLEIQRNEIFGFMGPDGAGKSTMMRIAMGILEPKEGECLLFGQRDRQKARENAGYVAQKFSLYQDMSVIENVHLFGCLYGKTEAEVDERAEYILSRVGLWGFRDRFAGRLSGGMKQKLALAIGLLNTPDILFLDEPTTGVDPVARREFWAMLYQFNSEGLTIVVSTPYMDEAELCTRKMFLSEGRILDVGTSGELISRYPYKLLSLNTGEHEVGEWLGGKPHIVGVNMVGATFHIVTDDENEAAEVMRSAFSEHGRELPEMHKITPSLEDLFTEFAGREAAQCLK